jgi:hypothetical protein
MLTSLHDTTEPGGHLQWDEANLAAFTPSPPEKEAVYAMDVCRQMMIEQNMCPRYVKFLCLPGSAADYVNQLAS